jgi:hypothetical protein
MFFTGTSRHSRTYEPLRRLEPASEVAKQAKPGWIMSSLRNQLRQVLRRLARAPMFTVLTLVTLAAGVGEHGSV